MRLNVRVIPNAKKNRIEEKEDCLKVYLSASPIQGKANKMLIKVLSVFYKVKKNKISIIKGEKTRNKVVDIFFNKT